MMLMVDMIRKFYFMVIMLMTCSFIIGQDVSLSMGNVDEQNGTFDILYDTQQNIYGFQLEIAGVGILDATSDYFDVMFNSEEEAGVIIGFSMSEDPAISPGVGVLASIMYQLEPWPSDICIHNSILSSDDSIALESTNGECYSVSGTVPIMISFGEVDLANRILEINYASYVEIQGFQLNVSGATILDVSNEYLSNIEFDSMTGSILMIVVHAVVELTCSMHMKKVQVFVIVKELCGMNIVMMRMQMDWETLQQFNGFAHLVLQLVS